MKKLFYILFVVALVLSSCANEDGPGIVKSEKVTIGAVAGEIVDADTRTGLYDGVGMHWFDGEQVGVFRRRTATALNNGVPTEFIVQSDGSFPSKTANLTGLFPASTTEPNTYIAVYPYESTAEYKSYMSSMITTIPSTQYYVNNGGVAGVRGIPMIAKGSVVDNTLNFQPIYALLRLRVKLNAAAANPIIIKSVKLTVNSASEYLSGRVNINGMETLTETALGNTFGFGWAGGNKFVTLDCGDGVELNKNEETILYIAVPSPKNSGVLQEGYKFEFISDDITLQASTRTTAITIKTGELYNLPLLTLNVPVVNTGIEMPDAALRNYLVGLGAAADLGDGTIEVTNPNLETVTLPSNVTSIVGLEAFENLKTLTGPANIVNLDITALTNLVTLTYRTSAALKSVNASGLKNLKTMNINNNSNLETLNVSGCTALTGLVIGSAAFPGVLSSGTISFSGNTATNYVPSLKNFIAEGLTQVTKITSTSSFGDPCANLTITNLSFANCTGLATITLAGSTQQTAITMNITGTPVASNAAGITGDNGKVTYIK